VTTRARFVLAPVVKNLPLRLSRGSPRPPLALCRVATMDPVRRRSSPIHERDVIAQKISPSCRCWLSNHFP